MDETPIDQMTDRELKDVLLYKLTAIIVGFASSQEKNDLAAIVLALMEKEEEEEKRKKKKK